MEKHINLDRLVVKLDESNSDNRLFKSRDRKIMDGLSCYLRKNGVDVFITGNVIKSKMLGYDYVSIDVFAVGKEKNNLIQIVIDLNNAEALNNPRIKKKGGKDYFKFREEMEKYGLLGIIVEKEVPLEYRERDDIDNLDLRINNKFKIYNTLEGKSITSPINLQLATYANK